MSNQVTEALDGIKKQVEQKQAQVQKEISGIRDEITELAQKGNTLPAGLNTASKNSIKSIFTKSAGFKAYQEGQTNSGRVDTGLSVKALTSLQGSAEDPAVGIDVTPQSMGGFVMPSLKPARLFERLNSLPMASNALKFTRLSAFSNAADYQAGEGTLKAEQDITPASVTAPVATIAVSQTSSKQVLDDDSNLGVTLDRLLRASILEKVENELVNGSGGADNISGLITEATAFAPTATTKAEIIGEAIASLQGEGYTPDIVAISPADWFAIRSERATGGEYVAGGWMQLAAPNVYGIPVVVVPALAAGTAMVIDSQFVDVLDRQALTLMASDSHKDNFTRNLVTLLAEIRVGLAVYDSGAVLSMSI